MSLDPGYSGSRGVPHTFLAVGTGAKAFLAQLTTYPEGQSSRTAEACSTEWQNKGKDLHQEAYRIIWQTRKGVEHATMKEAMDAPAHGIARVLVCIYNDEDEWDLGAVVSALEAVGFQNEHILVVLMGTGWTSEMMDYVRKHALWCTAVQIIERNVDAVRETMRSVTKPNQVVRALTHVRVARVVDGPEAAEIEEALSMPVHVATVAVLSAIDTSRYLHRYY